MRNDRAVKIAVLLLVPLVVSLLVFFLYRRYFFNNNFINKSILKKDMEFRYFTFDEFDSIAGQQDILDGVDTYYRNGSQYITNSGRDNMDADVIKMFDDARHIVETEYNKLNSENIYFVVNSGFRTDDRNDEVGGVPNSAHRNKEGKKSKAGDISWKKYNNQQRDIIEEALRRVGFVRIGKYNSFIHADNDRTLPYPANW